MAKNIAVFGVYATRAGVEEGIDALRAAGYRHEDISVLFPENEGTKDLAVEKHSKAPEGVATGATSGAIIGGALGWLIGAGLLAVPGVGPLLAAGPIVAVLTGVGAGGAVGGVVGALAGLGIPEYEAKRYEGRIRGGGILLSVHCDDSEWGKRARAILERTGAEEISSTGESKADYAAAQKPLPRTRPDTAIGETSADIEQKERADERRTRTAGGPPPEL